MPTDPTTPRPAPADVRTDPDGSQWIRVNAVIVQKLQQLRDRAQAEQDRDDQEYGFVRPVVTVAQVIARLLRFAALNSRG